MRVRPRHIAALAIVVIVVVIAAVGSASVRRYDRFMCGMWIADPGFLKAAGLQDMQLFVAPPEEGVRRGYMIVADAQGEFVFNQAVEIQVGSHACRWRTAMASALHEAHDKYTATITIGDSTPMPPVLKMSLSILQGTMTLHHNGKMYALLVKDMTTSAAALSAYDGAL